jgi:hypothetical protein
MWESGLTWNDTIKTLELNRIMRQYRGRLFRQSPCQLLYISVVGMEYYFKTEHRDRRDLHYNFTS